MSEHDDGAPAAEGTDRAPAGGRYRFVRRLSGDDDRPVWEAVDEWSGDPALLVHVPTPEDDAAGAAAIRRTVGQEVREAGTLNHPHVSPVLDAVSDGSAGLWVAGGTRPGLTLLASAPGVGDPDRVARWGRELADGLAALHAAGLVHRDPRPGMVGVDSSGTAMLLGTAATADRAAGAGAPEGDDGPGTRREDLRVLAQTLRTVAEPVAEGHQPSPGLRATLEYAAGPAPASAEEFREALAVLDSGARGSAGDGSPHDGSPGDSSAGDGSAGDGSPRDGSPGDRGSGSGPGGAADGGGAPGSGTASGGSGSGSGSVAAGAAGVAGVAAAGAGAAAMSGSGSGSWSDPGSASGPSGGSGPASGSDSETTTVRRPPAGSEETTRTVTPAPSDPTLQQGQSGSGEGQWSGAPASPWSPGERRPSSVPTAASNAPWSPWAGGGAAASSSPPPAQQPPSPPYGGPPYGSPYGQGGPQQSPGPWGGPPPAGAAQGTGERRGWAARHRTLVVVTSIVLAVVLVGGAATAGVLLTRDGGDTAAPAPAATPGPVPTAPAIPAGPIGDPQTADPCSLLSVSSFTRFGSPKLYDDFGSLSACEVDVTTADGGTVRTLADFYARGELTPPSVTERVGDVGVTRYPASDTGCRRALSLSDGTVVLISSATGTRAPNPPVDLCATADVGVSTATPILVAHAVARRAPGAGTSLNGIEGCSLLDPALVGGLPGVDVTKQVRLFGGWGCSVGYDAAFQNTAYANVIFYRDSTLQGTPTRIGRHTAIETPTPAQDGEVPSCEIEIAQRSYTGSSGVARVDSVRVRYIGAGPPTDPPDLCAALRPVAADVERRLPPPS